MSTSATVASAKSVDPVRSAMSPGVKTVLPAPMMTIFTGILPDRRSDRLNSTVRREAILIDSAEPRRIVGVDDRPPRLCAAVQIGVVQQVGIEVDHPSRRQRHGSDLIHLHARRVDLEAAARLEGADRFSEMTARHDLQAAHGLVRVVQVDETGDQLVRVGTPAAGPILVPGVRRATWQLEIELVLEKR